MTYWALKTPEKTVFRFCGADGEETETRSCSSLKARSSHVAHLYLSVVFKCFCLAKVIYLYIYVYYIYLCFHFCDLCEEALGLGAQHMPRLLDTTAFGDRVLLVYEPGLEFLDAFIGCLLSGRVAVPVYPPIPTQASSVKKFVTIQADCGAKARLCNGFGLWGGSQHG